MIASCILVIIVLILCIIHCYLRYDRAGRLVDKLPGPWALPIMGNALEFIGNEADVWKYMRALNAKYYPLHRVYRLWGTNCAFVNVIHPHDIEAILSTTQNNSKSIIYDLLHPWFGTGLLTSSNSKWQKRRKLLTPAFHFNILKKYSEIIIEHAEEFIESLKSNDEFIADILPLVTKNSLSVICEAAMGVRVNTKETQQRKYVDAVHSFGRLFIHRLIRPWYYWEPLFQAAPIGRRLKEILKILHGFSSSIIRDRQKYHDETQERYLKHISSDNPEDEDDDCYIGIRKKRLAMLDLLIAASRHGSQIDDDGIREEVDTFIFEGHDTSAMGMCFAILLLAEHTEIQARARAEVNDVLRNSGGKFGLSELQNCVYLERCIKESLRLYPSVPQIGRVIEHDVQLENYLIPRQTMVFIHIYETHRDPNFWKDPLVYNPDRFEPSQMQGRHPYSYIPFSAGPRNCIGQKFAMMELKATIGFLLHNFYLEAIDLAHKTEIVADLVIRPRHPLLVKFIPIIQDT